MFALVNSSIEEIQILPTTIDFSIRYLLFITRFSNI